MADESKVAYGLSKGAILNDLERPLTWFPRLCHCLTLNIAEMAKHTAIWKANRKSYPSFQMVPLSMTFSASNPHFKVTIVFNVK